MLLDEVDVVDVVDVVNEVDEVDEVDEVVSLMRLLKSEARGLSLGLSLTLEGLKLEVYLLRIQSLCNQYLPPFKHLVDLSNPCLLC